MVQSSVPEGVHIRDRIAMVGPSGAGKSTSILYLASHLIAATGARFVIVEGDDGFSKCLEEFNGQNGRPNLKALLGTYIFIEPTVTEWGGIWGKSAGLGKVQQWLSSGLLGPNDWVVTEALDIITTDMIRGEFVEKAGVSMGRNGQANQSTWEAAIEKRKKGQPLIDQGDWGAINGEIEKVLSFLSFKMPCNWIATTDIEPIRTGERGDDQVIKDLYMNMGMDVKMSGYKWLPRYFDTIVRVGKGITSGYNFAVYKNRGQRAVRADTSVALQFHPNQDFYNDFAKPYLGWR